MTIDALVELLQLALYLALVLSALPLAVSLLTGIFVSLLQNVLQIQESTLSFAPKMAAVGISLFILGPMMGRELAEFTRQLLALAAR
mgnify:CR=1 FL=1